MSDKALDMLRNMLSMQAEETMREEVIGGVSIADAIDAVELDIAYSPVCPYCGSDTVANATPTQGGESFIVHTSAPITVSRDMLRVMRCRYLLRSKNAQRESWALEEAAK